MDQRYLKDSMLSSVLCHKLLKQQKGIGAIYRRRKPRVRLDAIINGGGQGLISF
jgi:cysteine sulfinate desulfinase/cysteine desulfurase-like protein